MTDDQMSEQRRHWQYQDRIQKAILSVVTAGLIGGISWAIMTDRAVHELENRTETSIANDTVHSSQISGIRERLRISEARQARQDEQWRHVSATLEKIDRRLDEVIRAFQNERER